MLAAPIVVTVLNIVLQVVSVEAVPWPQWCANLAAFFILTKMWREVLKINENMRGTLIKQIEEAKAKGL